MADPIPHINVDFNNADDDGLIFARLARASAPLVEGAEVLATDEDGHRCPARVARVEGELAYLELDLDSWEAAERDTKSPLSFWQTLEGTVAPNGHSESQSESAPPGLLTL